MQPIKAGDIVISALGDRGVVEFVCDCDQCKERGFDEPRVVYDNGEKDYITDYDADHGFSRFYQIGDTVFPEHIKLEFLQRRIDEEKHGIAVANKRIGKYQALISMIEGDIDERD